MAKPGFARRKLINTVTAGAAPVANFSTFEPAAYSLLRFLSVVPEQSKGVGRTNDFSTKEIENAGLGSENIDLQAVPDAASSALIQADIVVTNALLNQQH